MFEIVGISEIVEIVEISVQRDSWSWSRNSRFGLSRPGIGLGLDRIFKSRLGLVLVSNKINGLAELRRSARLLVLVSTEFPNQDKSWSCS